jgi:hypothetical protein
MQPRVGRATVLFTALLCVASQVPAFAQHTPDGACESSFTELGKIALVVWAASAVLVLVSVIVDLARARPWSLVALPICVLVSILGLVVIFAESPFCFTLGAATRSEYATLNPAPARASHPPYRYANRTVPGTERGHPALLQMLHTQA